MTTTLSCAECGTRAEPGQSFCDACGGVLSWTERSGTRSDAGTAGPAPVAEPAAPHAPAEHAAPHAPSAPYTPPPAAAPPEQNGPAQHGGPGQYGSPASYGGPGQYGGNPGHPGAAGPEYGRDAAAPQAAAPPAPAPGPQPSDTSGQPHRTPGSAPPPAGAGAPAGPADGWVAYGPQADADTAPLPPQGTDAAGQPPYPGYGAAPTGPSAPAGAYGAAADGAMADRARQLLVPVADPGPAAQSPVAPVLPGRPEPRRPQAVQTPGQEFGVQGGLPCPWCGTPNRVDRHFCARCAMPMTREEQQSVARLPWWRRLFRRGGETPWAGDRPRLRRTFDRILGWLGAAIVLGLLIALAVNIPQGVQAARDHFAKRAPVAPDSVTASRSYPDHSPQLAFDKLNNTWWGPGVSDSGQGQWIEARFKEPTRLLDLLITPGVSIREDQISKSALPHQVTVTITTADGKTVKRELTLDQGAGGQPRAFKVGDVTAVRFTIDSAYAASGKKQVAIAEIEFFGPSHSNS